MCERRIVEKNGAYIVFDRDDHRIGAYASRTEAIDAAIEAVETRGGGTVVLPDGNKKSVEAVSVAR